MTKFIIQNEQLMLQRAGKHILPTADEVYRSVIEEVQIWEDVLPGKISAPKDITFSRYPASVKLVVEQGLVDGVPEIQLAYFINTNKIIKNVSPSLNEEHFIYEKVCYQIDI